MVKDTSTPKNKKRKASNPEHDIEVDVYKRVIDFEEKEAANRSSSVDAKIYLDVCQDIHDILTSIVEKKQNGEKMADKNEYLTQLVVKICAIKKLNRIDKLLQVTGRDILNSEKQKCDSIKLSYQNLVYELHHLLSETNKCLSFKSKDEDIDLVPIEVFMREAPESITSKFKKMDENDVELQHNLRLARLEWELTQRKNLAELCKSLEEEKKKVVAEINERKERLLGLQPLLDNILKATKPLQDHLGLTLDSTRTEHDLANLLPDPLYILYANVVSFNSVFNINLKIYITGDKDEAEQWNETRGNANNEEDSEPEPDLQEEIVEVKKRRHRKTTLQVDPMEEKKKKLLEAHPLLVEISLNVEDGPTLTLSFQYYTKLRIVTVKSKVEIPTKITGNAAREILSGDNILNELQEGDSGLESPNPSTQYQLGKINLNSFQSLVPDVGYAYGWAQGVCGIDFLKKQTFSEKLGQKNVELVMKLLQKRLATRIHLARQIQQLENNFIPKIPHTIKIPSNIVTSITKWFSITYQTFCQAEFTKAYASEEFVSHSDLFYSINLMRGNATAQAYVAIKNSYPSPPPIFAVCVNYKEKAYSYNSDDIRDMERYLNVEIDLGISAAWLLSVQVAHLCSLIDVFLETVDVETFPQSSTFFRPLCGRNRKRPFKFKKVGSGIFTQY